MTRIQELKIQAQCWSGRDGIAGPYMELDEDLFAKLIIEDCKEICRKAHRNDLCNAIDTHFGDGAPNESSL